ncbi:hypothetical protein ACIQH5_14655 [Paenarthrobacter sp. NPDC091711]|uniref:hypothetical protein n=1 Tax=Paenarthrobacter sp. NPDC091711 TaxID=3364385 RepID=UPI0037F2772C
MLIVPGAFVGHRFSFWIGQVNKRTLEATEQADTAKRDAATAQADVNILSESVATDIKTLREQLIADQVAEAQKEHSVYAKLAHQGDRASLVQALKTGRESSLISHSGVRVPVWETALHFRFNLSSDDDETLTVNFEWDDGTVAASHVWSADKEPLAFYRELWRSVQETGEYLGVGLFDPTESLGRLSEAMEYASRYRAQKLRMGSANVREIIEYVDGWYITDRGMFPKNNEHLSDSGVTVMGDGLGVAHQREELGRRREHYYSDSRGPSSACP